MSIAITTPTEVQNAPHDPMMKTKEVLPDHCLSASMALRGWRLARSIAERPCGGCVAARMFIFDIKCTLRRIYEGP
jgi:hypothetical protein